MLEVGGCWKTVVLTSVLSLTPPDLWDSQTSSHVLTSKTVCVKMAVTGLVFSFPLTRDVIDVVRGFFNSSGEMSITILYDI